MSAHRVRSDAGISRIALIAGGMLATVDVFVVIVALGAIGRAFPGVDPDGLLWAAVIFPLVSAALIIPAGPLSRWAGVERAFIFGVLVFVTGSVVCGLAPAYWVLVVGRGIQGVGAAALISTSMSLLVQGWSAIARKRLVSRWAAASAVAAAAGPVLGGMLVPFDWRFAFFVNILFAVPILAAACGRAKPRGAREPLPDLAGSVLLAATLVATVVAVSSAASDRVAAGLAGGAALLLLCGFIIRCAYSSRPVLDLRLLRTPSFAAALSATLVFYTGFAFMVAGSAQALTRVLNLPAPLIGLAFAVGPASALVSTLTIGRLNLRPATLITVSGALFAAGGLWWLVMFSGGTPTLLGYLPGIILTGLGVGNAQSSLLNGGSARLPAHIAPSASPVLNTVRQIGTTVGIAVFIAIAAQTNVTGLYDFTWAWAGIATAGTFALAASLFFAWPKPSADEARRAKLAQAPTVAHPSGVNDALTPELAAFSARREANVR